MVVMLSELVRRTVVDRSGRRARLVDVGVDLAIMDDPPIVLLVVRTGKDRRVVPSEQIVKFHDPIRVSDLTESTPCSEEFLDGHDLLRRDVLDQLVLDLDQERAVRVNDIWLKPAAAVPDAPAHAAALARGGDTGLVVNGIDVSPQAILRRITRGFIGGAPAQLVKWTDVELLRGDPGRARINEDIAPRVARLLPARIADLADALPYLHAAELLTLLDVPLAADVFELMLPERQIQVIGEIDGARAIAMLAEVAPDHVADVLGNLPLDDAREILERLPRPHAILVADLLRYPPGTAGGIMTNDVVIVATGLTVAEAIDAIRPRLASPDLAYYVYVVADLTSRRLVGMLTLRELLLARHEQPIAEVMNERLVTAEPLENAAVVAYRLADHQLNALPVVDAERRLLGVVTIDQAIAQIAPEALRQDLPRVFA
jgi:CBS domain-containing protein